MAGYEVRKRYAFLARCGADGAAPSNASRFTAVESSPFILAVERTGIGASP
jgi:hypothetical protein